MSTVIQEPQKNSHFKNLIPIFQIIFDNNFDLNVILNNNNCLIINGTGIQGLPLNFPPTTGKYKCNLKKIGC